MEKDKGFPFRQEQMHLKRAGGMLLLIALTLVKPNMLKDAFKGINTLLPTFEETQREKEKEPLLSLKDPASRDFRCRSVLSPTPFLLNLSLSQSTSPIHLEDSAQFKADRFSETRLCGWVGQSESFPRLSNLCNNSPPCPSANKQGGGELLSSDPLAFPPSPPAKKGIHLEWTENLTSGMSRTWESSLKRHYLPFGRKGVTRLPATQELFKLFLKKIYQAWGFSTLPKPANLTQELSPACLLAA